MHGRALGPLLNQPHGRLEQLSVQRRVGSPRLVPLIEVRELDPQQRGLKTVEAFVVAELDVLSLRPLPEVAQPR